jgi:hypothetical protein
MRTISIHMNSINWRRNRHQNGSAILKRDIETGA